LRLRRHLKFMANMDDNEVQSNIGPLLS